MSCRSTGTGCFARQQVHDALTATHLPTPGAYNIRTPVNSQNEFCRKIPEFRQQTATCRKTMRGSRCPGDMVLRAAPVPPDRDLPGCDTSWQALYFQDDSSSDLSGLCMADERFRQKNSRWCGPQAVWNFVDRFGKRTDMARPQAACPRQAIVLPPALSPATPSDDVVRSI